MSYRFTSSHDQWIKCISRLGTLRAVALNASEISQSLADRHHMTDDGQIRALGEAIVGGLLLASASKSGEKINLNIQANGWAKQTFIDVNSSGEVRGYVTAPEDIGPIVGENLGPWGDGLLSVLRTKFDKAQPYIGTVPLITGHLAKDLTFYWHQSEQVNSAVGIHVRVDAGQIQAADGFLIQAMPGASDDDLIAIERHLTAYSNLKRDDLSRTSPRHRISFLLDQEFTLLEESPLSVYCPCSHDRVSRSLSLIGTGELTEIVNDAQPIEIKCDFCSENYVFSIDQIKALIKT